jgi:valyl-tRNA synthetase
MMDNRFEPTSVEARIAAAWEDAGAFRAGRADRAGAEPYSIVIPPPNVTGNLHMGHALNNTLQDILCRFERMRGKDVLWQPGTDHAGIATQMIVERQLAERKLPGRREMGRDAFLKRVWEWKAESGGAIVNQLKRLGASCDWSRERFTMDEGLSKAVVKVFVELHKKNLIYKAKRLVNWDPKFLTAISDLEVELVDVKGHLWHFKYPIENSDSFIIVATTRPETMLGDTAIAVHPENEKLKDFIGKYAILPLVGRRIPIVADDYADPEKGTGAVKITPAHDFNDFELGKRHSLPLINILDAEAKLSLWGNLEFARDLPPSADLDHILTLHGMDRFAARKAIVALMEERELLDKIEPHVHKVPHGDRSGVVIEPWLTDQWYVDAKTLAAPALAAVQDGRTRFVPKNNEKVYFHWLENIEPWCISRQLWWGHQIPAWYGPDGEVFVAETQADAEVAALKHYGHICALRRDEDVLDTWFSSALWPFSTMGWPDQTPELKRFYPTAVVVTGFDIIFFWVARMMMMGLQFCEDVPFHDIYIHGLVLDEKGQKMSKTKGNVVDPLELIDQYGADALRFFMAISATQGRNIKMAKTQVEGYRNFTTKLWNAARFAEMNSCVRSEHFNPKTVKAQLNQWIIGETSKTVLAIGAAFEAYRFNEAATHAYRFVWNIFCDWHLELVKPVLQGDDSAEKDETRATIAYVLDQILKLLHPFMPFMTEELWAIKGADGPAREGLLALAQWPQLADLANPDAEASIGFIVDLVSEIRSLRSEMNINAGAQIPLKFIDASDQIKALVEMRGETIKRLARISEISFAAAAPAGSVQLVVRGQLAALPLAGLIDFVAERLRLTKEIAKWQSEVDKIDARFANADFVARAKEDVIEENRERQRESIARIDKLQHALAGLETDASA